MVPNILGSFIGQLFSLYLNVLQKYWFWAWRRQIWSQPFSLCLAFWFFFEVARHSPLEITGSFSFVFIDAGIARLDPLIDGVYEEASLIWKTTSIPRGTYSSIWILFIVIPNRDGLDCEAFWAWLLGQLRNLLCICLLSNLRVKISVLWEWLQPCEVIFACCVSIIWKLRAVHFIRFNRIDEDWSVVWNIRLSFWFYLGQL